MAGSQPSRVPSRGEQNAYALGFQLAMPQRKKKVTESHRREVHTNPDGSQVLIEVITVTEEDI